MRSKENSATVWIEDGAFALFFRAHRAWGILQLKFSSPGNLQSKAKKNTNARGLAGGGGRGWGDWAQLDLTDA